MGSLPAPLQPIPPDAVDLNFAPPQYSNIFAETVGNAVTESDGWQVIFDDASQVLSTWPDFLTSLDLDLTVIDSILGEVDQIWEQDFAESLGGAISSGQSDFNSYAVALQNNTPPAPTAAPGGSGGGGGTSQANCTAIVQYDSANTQPVTQQVMFRNIDTVPITITSKTLVDPTPGTFKVVDQIPTVLGPQKSALMLCTQEKPAAFGYKATYTIIHSGKGSPAVLCLEVGSANIDVGGGGGASGGPLFPGPAPVQP